MGQTIVANAIRRPSISRLSPHHQQLWSDDELWWRPSS